MSKSTIVRCLWFFVLFCPFVNSDDSEFKESGGKKYKELSVAHAEFFQDDSCTVLDSEVYSETGECNAKGDLFFEQTCEGKLFMTNLYSDEDCKEAAEADAISAMFNSDGGALLGLSTGRTLGACIKFGEASMRVMKCADMWCTSECWFCDDKALDCLESEPAEDEDKEGPFWVVAVALLGTCGFGGVIMLVLYAVGLWRKSAEEDEEQVGFRASPQGDAAEDNSVGKSLEVES